MNIYIAPQLEPEVGAMLQAFYSRSHESMQKRIESEPDPEKLKASLKQYYLGYGHDSINQNAFVTIAIEGVSMIAAKAIQDNQLYNGQESSTRYIPFDKQPIVSPPIEEGDVAAKFMAVHTRLTKLCLDVELQNIAADGEVCSAAQIRGVEARVFDYTRCFLPLGTTTQLSWVTSLHAARDNCIRLMASVYEEVRSIGVSLWNKLHSQFPNSFEAISEIPDHKQNLWSVDMAQMVESVPAYTVEPITAYSYKRMGALGADFQIPKFIFSDEVEYGWADDVLSHLKSRPYRTSVPRRVDMIGRMVGTIPIDYGCWRELQRHRSAHITSPVLAPNCMHPWYTKSIYDIASRGDDPTRTEILSLYTEGCELLYSIGGEKSPEYHYHLPLGCQVYCEIDCGLASAIYIAELRSRPSVHPILRGIAQAMGRAIQRHYDIPVYVNDEEQADRSNQTFIKSENNHETPGVQG